MLILAMRATFKETLRIADLLKVKGFNHDVYEEPERRNTELSGSGKHHAENSNYVTIAPIHKTITREL